MVTIDRLPLHASALVLALGFVAACGASNGSRANPGSGGSPGAGTGGAAGSGGTVGTGGAPSSGSGGRPPCLDTLNDPQNCGACYNVCGGRKELAPKQKAPGAVVLSGGTLYWVTGINTSAEQGIMKMASTGGTPVALVTNENIAAIAVDATHVYFLGSKALKKVSVDGGAATTMAPREERVGAIAIDATNVYWTGYRTPCPEDDLTCDTIMQVAKAGGSPTTLASGQSGIQGLTVDDTNVYWSTDSYNFLKGAIHRVGSGGGAITTLASQQVGINGPMTVRAGYVYWTSGGTGLNGPIVTKMPTTGGTPVAIVTGMYSGVALTADESSLYWVSGSSLFTAPLAGGSPRLLVSGNSPRDIATDSRTVYWTDGGSGVTLDGGSVSTLAPTTCQAGQCACPAGQMLCLGACVDAQTHALQCGR